jgi:Tfp pilus assembly protein PilF
VSFIVEPDKMNNRMKPRSTYFEIALLSLFLIFLCACTKSPEPADHVHGNLGTKYWEQGKLELAEIEMKKAIELNPNSSVWHQNLGVIYKSMGREDEAINGFETALRINRNWGTAPKVPVLIEIGYYHYSKRNYGRSIKAYEAALNETKEATNPETLNRIY